ncbi:MAG: hypothetical protein IKA95_04860, partial [Clostridia bacterium]|nr:hypothetical protein [Clostridia bacterium]
MKKIVGLIAIITIMLSMTLTAFAGSIPEDLLHSDEALIFFAEVVCYHPNKENPDIEFSPVKKIKGDVKLGTKQIAYNFNTIGDFDIKVGNVYLFTYFDENNPTDIFEVTSYDTSTLKLKNVEGDMWERFENYLNEGRYLAAEHDRIDKNNSELLVEGGKTLTLSEILGTDNSIVGDVSIHYAEGLDSKAVQIDRADFFKVADTIICKEIEKTDHINIDGFYIVADINNAVYISDDGKISHNNPMLSYVAQAEYMLNSEDLAKLKQYTIPESEQIKLPPLESPYARYIVYGVLLGV